MEIKKFRKKPVETDEKRLLEALNNTTIYYDDLIDSYERMFDEVLITPDSVRRFIEDSREVARNNRELIAELDGQSEYKVSF